MRSIRLPALLALLFAGAAVVPSSLSAQQTLVADSGGASAQIATSTGRVPALPLLGPRLLSVPLVSLAPAGPVDTYAPQDQVRAGHNVAMMAVGGAGLVAGLLIGGDSGIIIASAGTVVGLIGLYRYLR